ncbi:MAG: hypothetical protein Tsb008_22220 [Rhodothalassiaceae bacterium]
MKTHPKLAFALASFLATPALSAPVVHDQNVFPGIIFGDGNANGGFTVDRANNIELGLRAKVRFDLADDLPKNIFNSNGDGTFSHAAGAPASNPTRARWNFEFSINSYLEGTAQSPTMLSDYVYRLRLDFDPGLGTNFFEFDPINGFPCFDHALGNNATTEANNSEVDCSAPSAAADWAAAISSYNVAQNSWNLDFFNELAGVSFDPTLNGIYDFTLSAFTRPGSTPTAGMIELASTSIRVLVGNAAIPAPATLALFGIGLAGFGMGLRRRKG